MRQTYWPDSSSRKQTQIRQEIFQEMDMEPTQDCPGEGYKGHKETDRWTYSQEKTVQEMDIKDAGKQTDGLTAKIRQSWRWTQRTIGNRQMDMQPRQDSLEDGHKWRQQKDRWAYSKDKIVQEMDIKGTRRQTGCSRRDINIRQERERFQETWVRQSRRQMYQL